MATNFWDLPEDTRIKLATDATLKGFGVTVPVTTEQSRNHLLQAKVGIDELFSAVRAKSYSGPLRASTGFRGQPSTVAQNTPIPAEVISLLGPYFPGYDLSGGSLSNLDGTVSGLQDSINNLVNNQRQLPPQGANVTYNPNNTTPPIGTVQAPIQPVLPTNSNSVTTTNPSNNVTPPPPPVTTTRPVTTTSPSQRSGSSTLETIAKVSLAVAGVAAVTNIIGGAKKTKPETTSAPNTTGTTPPASTTGSATPGAPAKEPKTVLKFGDEIDDIYDKTLTPEQIASLSPGDRKAREAFLAESNTNADTAQNEIVVTATRSAVEFDTQAKASAQDAANFESFEDWRVRLTLAPDAEYMYRASNPGIMAPLAATDGVIFPYTPLISVNYQATYDASTIVHSNYKIYQYTNSAVDQVTISCDFTAQDTSEANYLLATIHFFRSMTKMFYGQDQYPKPGTPPPLCFLFGLGGFQFDAHPLVITGFSYNLPNDVDYIRTTTTIDSTNVTKNGYSETAGNGRLPTGVLPGGVAAGATFDNDGGGFSPTYVPTKIQLSITAYPIVTRNQISNQFSLTDYATGKLLQGSQRQGGGIW